MRVWLLQSRKGGRTCGHLHVRESGAWRCRDTQAEPAAWSVVSTWLSDPEGGRRKPDKDLVCVFGFMAFVILPLPVGAFAFAWWSLGQAVWLVLVAVFVVVVAVGLVVLPISMLVDELRDPRPWGGWDWL